MPKGSQMPRVSLVRKRSGSVYRAAAALLLAAIMLAGCAPGVEGPEAERVGELYFEAVKAGDYEAVAALYDRAVPRDALIAELTATRERYGELEGYTMTDLVSYIGSGVPSYTLKYKTRYANHHATETLLMQPGEDRKLYIKRNDFHVGGAR